jgi:DNA-binding beta-propeller fold protein YncE
MFLSIFLAVPFNQPKFCSNASWNPNATTFANITMVGSYPAGIFISTDNTVYVVDQTANQIIIWLEGSSSPTRIISGGLNNPFGVFVSLVGNIYIDNGHYNGRVDKWALNTTNSSFVMYVSVACIGLFIDINNNLYCSMQNMQQVVMKSLNDEVKTSKIVAGTGCLGSSSYTLYNPQGIFVDINLNLYIADSGNSRIQLFRSGQLSGTTVAGNGFSNPITLYWPTGVVLDADGYLFIVDTHNNRIVASGPYGFRCVVGCSGIAGSGSDQLWQPFAISFDSYGNIFVTDSVNRRVQKFLLATNSCGKCDNIYI